LEVEHVEEVAENRHIVGNVGIGFVELRIGEIVAAAIRQRIEAPVVLDEFHKGSMVAVRVLDMATL
jgi:hypothetical protein